MKRTFAYLFAAIAVLTVASCTKEMSDVAGRGELRTITVSYAQSATKTDLTEDGKTVWGYGDQIFVSNGLTSETIDVPESAVGEKNFVFETTLEGDLYVVSPAYCALGTVTDGKADITIPKVQDGVFGNANIAVGKAQDEAVVLKNATALLKVAVNPDAGASCIVVGGYNEIAGTFSASCTSTPALTAKEGSKTIIVDISESPEEVFYVAVAPGTYEAGFNVSVVSELGLYDGKTTNDDVTLNVNDMADLGSFGDSMHQLEGAGTPSNPFLIGNLAEYLVMTYSVNKDEAVDGFAGRAFKLTNDIDGVTMPVGYYDSETETDWYFKGEFNGNGCTVTVDIDGESCTGMFGDVGPGANIHDVTVAGKVKGTKTSGGLIGCLNAGSGATVTNCTNNATVIGGNNMGGIIGYCDATANNALVIDGCENNGDVTGSSYYVGGIIGQGASAFNKIVKNCTNNGAITASHTAGGLVGYGYYVLVSDSSNSGDVVATDEAATGMYGLEGSSFKFDSGYNKGTGGIVGWSQNGSINGCSNSGDVSAANKVGGIAGAQYWTGVANCDNSGNITASKSYAKGLNFGSAAGGITGWLVNRMDIKDCHNSGDINAKGGCGGIVGVSMPQTWAVVYIQDCVNDGDVYGAGIHVGGIAGVSWNQAGAKYNIIQRCVNNGDVTATSHTAGGIVGNFYDANNAKQGYIIACENNGTVKGMYYVGGLAGWCQPRASGPAYYIRNSANHGDVICTRTDAQPAYSGGLVGIVSNYAPGLTLKNCYNDGKVIYTNNEYDTQYVGGLVGWFRKGDMANCYNAGKVGPASGSEAEGADVYTGSIAGGNDGTIANCYWVEGSYTAAFGTKWTAPATVLSFNSALELESEVTVNGVSTFSVAEALNAWVNGSSTYFGWTPSLDFVK